MAFEIPGTEWSFSCSVILHSDTENGNSVMQTHNRMCNLKIKKKWQRIWKKYEANLNLTQVHYADNQCHKKYSSNLLISATEISHLKFLLANKGNFFHFVHGEPKRSKLLKCHMLRAYMQYDTGYEDWPSVYVIHSLRTQLFSVFVNWS